MPTRSHFGSGRPDAARVPSGSTNWLAFAKTVPSDASYETSCVRVPGSGCPSECVGETRATLAITAPPAARCTSADSLNKRRRTHGHMRRVGRLGLLAMPMFRELTDQVAAASKSAVPLEQLHEWLAGHVQAIADSRDVRARWLADQVWLRVIDYADGRRDAGSVRKALSELLDDAIRRPDTPARAG